MAVVYNVPRSLHEDTLQIDPEAGDLVSAAENWVEMNTIFIKNMLAHHKKHINEDQIEKFQAAYDGYLEEIDERDKSRGDGINHKLFVNMAQLIIDTVVDYMTGKPITWTFQAAENEEVSDQLLDEYRAELTGILKTEEGQRVLSEMLRQGCIGGYSPIFTWVNEEGQIEYEEFPVQEVIPIYDTKGRLRLVLRTYEVEDENDDNPIAETKVEVYDGRYVLYLVSNSKDGGFILDPMEQETGNPIEHKAGRIPVALYQNGTPARYKDRQKKVGSSDLKAVYSLLVNLSEGVSDKANTVDRLLDQFLKLKGVQTDEKEVQTMRKARAIRLNNPESDADFIAPKQEDTAVENHLNRVEDKIHKTTQTPKVGDIGGKTATEIKVAFRDLDIKAGKKELYFLPAVYDFIKILTDMLNYKKLVEAGVSDPYAVITGDQEGGSAQLYNPAWVKATINRNQPENFQEVATIVSQLAGVVPDKYLYELLWFIEDPQAALDEMKEQRKEKIEEQRQNGLSAMGFGGEFSNTQGGGNNGEDD